METFSKTFSTNLAHADGVNPFAETVCRSYVLGIDVGPVLRRFLTRADDFFDGRLSLTLCDELVRGQVPERAVWAVVIVIHPPGFDDGLRLGERRELVYVQALVAEPPVT